MCQLKSFSWQWFEKHSILNKYQDSMHEFGRLGRDRKRKKKYQASKCHVKMFSLFSVKHQREKYEQNKAEKFKQSKSVNGQELS